ncbi:NUDIX domain-containing protein [Paraoerskovia marina]|uniref:ADP-ribose pyrophosphatase YjhB, NUDIX family n=1 Tax=Paraoerskovia marina TaxID=545619 RepID=A0A1H1PP94_9CELL|nr:NUDIX domain-containing protein [Paraoerskovia marina]SDS13122.1 ADP-ribose pyrophosphatase YjhB, NUDIX family [Paraoerskovia marina]
MAIPEHVAHLRSRVGTDLLWMPGVTGVVLRDDGRLLLGRRADSGRWALLSGILDPGEEPARGFAREVLEESAVVVEVVGLVSLTTTPVIVYPNGDRTQYLDAFFLARAVSDEAAERAQVNDDESLAIGWFSVDDLPDVPPSVSSRIAEALDFAREPGPTRFV